MAATGFSHIFSGCFVTLLIWGCTTVVCLVDEKLDVQPATTTGYQSIGMSPEPVHGVTPVPFACGNITGRCEDICDICRSLIDVPRIDCLYILYEQVCQLNFMSAMNFLQSSDWCRWSKVRSLYSNFSTCTEEMSDCLLIPWPNSRVEQIFVDIHSEFFKDCPTEELSDPPEAIVFALVMTPICLIPIMVSLVVLKTKNGDGSS